MEFSPKIAAMAFFSIVLFVSAIAFAADANFPIDSNNENLGTIFDQNHGQKIFTISIVSPSYNAKVSKSGIVIVSIQPLEQLASAWFEIDGLHDKNLSAENLLSDFNSLDISNGEHSFSVHACNGQECVSESIPIIVENIQETVQDFGLQQDETVVVKGSNAYSAMTLSSLDGNIVAAGTDFFETKPKTYNARIDFIESIISVIQLDGAIVDSNKELVEVDEAIDETMVEPANKKLMWVEIVAVKPNVSFSSGKISFNVPKNSGILFKCSDWSFNEKKCNGSWEKIQELGVEETLEMPISATDPAFGFSRTPELSFGRNFDCHKCGQHKAPPLTNIEVQITAASSMPLQNAVLSDFFPATWQLIDAMEGVVSDVNSEFKKIEWAVDVNDSVSKSYVLSSPDRTLPPTKYYFFSKLDDYSSDYWQTIVADPATDVNLTVTGCSGGTTINSCSGLNTRTSAQDVTNTKNAIFIAGMSNASYTNSINSVKVYVDHSGASGITGAVAITLRDNAGTTTYCTEDTSIANTTSFKLDVLTACTPTGGWTAAKLDDLNVSIKNTDGGGATLAYYDYITVTVNYNPNGKLSFNISNPSADSNTSVNNNTDFLVNGTTYCNTDNCGTVDTNLQYCIGTGCSNWLDLNTSTDSPLYIVSGSNPQSSALNASQNYAVLWVVKSTVAQAYELRFSGSGTTADANTTNGTGTTITTQSVADYSFALSYPSTGCTQGKGSFDAGVTCDRAYFETTDLSGTADQNKVDPEGQTSTTPFFVYDNQSTASNDINFTLDLNAALPATLQLKVSKIYGGWASSCTGNTDVNCVQASASPQNIGKAVFQTGGTQDLNIFVWADFVSATVGSTDRNVTSTGGSPT